jgi:hypothetical protein
MTTFGDQVYQFGGSPVGGLPYSHLIGPQGKAIFCSPYRTASSTNASQWASDSNDGSKITAPVKTLARAYALADGGDGDVIYLLSYGNSAADITDDLSATFTWAKNAVHLVGLCAPTAVSQRARLNQLSTATGVSPLLNVTGNNCVFANFQIFQGVADATSLVNVQVTGQRNVFENVHFAGVGNATMSAAGSADVKIAAGAENVFKNCVFGVDTATRDADATNLWFDTAATRNHFEDCLFQGFISAAGYANVTIEDSTGIDRWQRFKRCIFLTESANDATQQTTVFNFKAALTQGYVLLEDSYAGTSGGTAEWDSNNRGRIFNNAVASATSAAGGVLTRQ